MTAWPYGKMSDFPSLDLGDTVSQPNLETIDSSGDLVSIADKGSVADFDGVFLDDGTLSSKAEAYTKVQQTLVDNHCLSIMACSRFLHTILV